MTDSAVETLYKDFVGADDLKILTERFSIADFVGRWEQVMTSVSTQIMGTGITFSSVNATYELQSDGNLRVLNSAYNRNLEKIYIQGVSRKRNVLDTCRTVQFDNLGFEGDYWLFYVSKAHDIVLVAAPLIAPIPIFPVCLTGKLGLYVLTKNREQFWANPASVAEVQSVLKKYGFDSFYNTPIFSGISIPITSQMTDAAISSNKVNL
jgi:lipocalin